MTFQSVHHPGAVSQSWLALQAQARPVAVALLAVMTVGLAAALRGHDVLWPFLGAATLAYAVGAYAAHTRLVTTPAAIEVRGPFATVRSIWEAASDASVERLEPVVSARLQHGELSVGLGDHIVELRPADWPEFDALVSAFRGAALEGQALLAQSPPS